MSVYYVNIKININIDFYALTKTLTRKMYVLIFLILIIWKTNIC